MWTFINTMIFLATIYGMILMILSFIGELVEDENDYITEEEG